MKLTTGIVDKCPQCGAKNPPVRIVQNGRQKIYSCEKCLKVFRLEIDTHSKVEEKMKRLAILFFALAISAYAQKPVSKQQVTTPGTTATTHQAVLTWVNPNTCTDGTPCTPVAITVYKIVGTCSAPTTQFTKLASLSGTTRTYTDTGLAAATTYCYYVTASLALPPAWDSATTYTGGQTVSYNGVAYVALNNANPNLNQPPATSTTFWAPSAIESAASNTAGGSTTTTGPPNPPATLTITVQ
jgi:hypothetical protein